MSDATALPAPPGPQSSAEILAREGWNSRLAGWVTGALVAESITGLVIWLAPFSLSGQFQVLLHTLLGLALLVPASLYVAGHLRSWWRQRMTAVMLLGYALLAATLVSVVTGLFVTWQCFMGPKLSIAFDDVHLVSALAVTALLVVHLVMAWQRRRLGLTEPAAFRAAVRLFMVRVGVFNLVCAVLVTVLAALWPESVREMEPPEGYSMPAYAQNSEEYRGNPFAPTYARTANGKLVPPELLGGSESCGSSGCHEQIYKEWLPSAHRFSAANPPFQQVQKNFAADREPAETRYCAGCHDPISLFAGAKDIHNMSLSAPGMQEGCSCVACHSLSKVDQRGNADYVLTPPQKYIGENGSGFAKEIADFLIRAWPRQHLADYDRAVLKQPEFCGACHKQFIPEALNHFGVTPGQNQFDEWRRSHWHAEEPLKDLSCRDCHMRLVADSSDPGHGEGGDPRRTKDDGKHRHHGSIGTNFLMPEVMKLEGWQEQVRLTHEWMRGETILPEIQHLWPEGPVATCTIVSPESIEAGAELELGIGITNRKAGHNFITGPLDFIRAWVHLVVRDADGRILAEWGGIDPVTRGILDTPGVAHEIGNARDKGTLVLEGMPVNAAKEPLIRHELWKAAGGKSPRVIYPLHSDNQTYRLLVPADARGPLAVSATLNFRRYRQEFLDLVVPEMERESGVLQPTVAQSTALASIPVTAPTGAR